MNTRARARRGGFTQTTDATDPVPELTPCYTPPAGWRFCRLVVSRLQSASTTSSGTAAHPCRGVDPGHPTLRLKLIEAVYELHLVLAIRYRGSAG
jgi:hypothetical protein